MSDKGKVYLVGAGPGDPELLTRKAERLLKEADVILFDALVGEGIKELFPQGAKLVDVGKRADDHAYPQEEINRMLVTRHRSMRRWSGSRVATRTCSGGEGRRPWR